jgi:hypothetical protein
MKSDKSQTTELHDSITKHKRKRSMRNQENFFRVFLIFLTQIVFFIINIISKYESLQKDRNDTFFLLVGKLICSAIVHLMCQPRIEDSISRIYYLRNHFEYFEDPGSV